MNYIVLNGQRSTNIKGLLIQSLPPISKPLMRNKIEQIDGRDGDIVTKLGFSAYNKQMSIGLFGDYDVDEVIQFFTSEGTVIFSNEPDKFYYYQILDQIDFERLIRFKTATVTFHVQPFKHSVVDYNHSFSNNKITLKAFSETQHGIDVSAIGRTIEISADSSAEACEFYIPIKKVDIDAGDYVLEAVTTGTVEGCKLRVVEFANFDDQTFGGADLELENDGLASIDVSPETTKTYRFIWLYVPSGARIATIRPVIRDYDVDSFNIINRGNIYSKPKITIFGVGDIVLKINDSSILAIALSTNQYITIDATEMNAYKKDVLKNRLVTGDYDNVRLKTGFNKISWSGAVDAIEITDFSRWI